MNIPSLKIDFSEQERKWILNRIDRSLKEGQLSQGDNVKEFEEKFASYVGAKYAIAVNSGTSAIEICMRSLNITGEEVLVPTNTFMATAAGVLFAGGNVRLVDTDPNTLSVNLKDLKSRVTKNTKGVIVVHIGGIITPEIEEIRNWCGEQGLWLFEDAAHAHGSSFNGKKAGTFGVAGSYSLFATKIITSGEGGVIVTNDEKIDEMARLYRNHGKPKPWITYNTHLGYNWRMNDITAAIALSQLEKLDTIIAKREKIANRYTELLQERLPQLKTILPKGRSSYYKYIVVLPKQVDRDLIKESMKEYGVSLQGEVYGIPLHKQPVAEKINLSGSFPKADNICKGHICLPIYPSLSEAEVKYIVDKLRLALKKAV